MLRALALCLVLFTLSAGALAGCSQIKARAPGSQVGKASTPNASGFLDMPILTSLSESEARSTLAESQMTGNVKVEKVECYDKAIPPGHVCNTYPGGGEKTTTTSDVTLFIVGP